MKPTATPTGSLDDCGAALPPPTAGLTTASIRSDATSASNLLLLRDMHTPSSPLKGLNATGGGIVAGTACLARQHNRGHLNVMWLSPVKVLGGPRAEIRFRAARPDMVVIEHLRPTDEPPKYFQPPVRRMARSSVHSPKRNLFPAISGATTARAAPSRQERTFVFQVLPKAVGRAILPNLCQTKRNGSA